MDTERRDLIRKAQRALADASKGYHFVAGHFGFVEECRMDSCREWWGIANLPESVWGEHEAETKASDSSDDLGGIWRGLSNN